MPQNNLPIFNSIISGTNTTAAMVVGSGSSLAATGTGTITATSMPASGLTGTSLPSLITTSSLTSFGSGIALGTPASGNLANCTFPTLNQNTTGSAASFTGSLAGDVTGTQGSTTVGKINGTSLAGLATGILKNTTTTGVPSIAVAGTDYQAPITLTTTGTSGAATFVGNTLNIPQYSGGSSGVSSFSGDGTILGNSSSTGAVTATLKNATAYSVLGNATGSAAAPAYTQNPIVSGTITAGGISLPALSTAGIVSNNSSGTFSSTATTGSGNVVLATSPTLVTPDLGTPSSGNLANCTFPTLNQNTTGSAASFTGSLAGDVTGTQSSTSVVKVKGASVPV
jgi:hypothetical protein